MNLSTKLRASGVKRWHIVETTREQNLAEHSFNVTMIALELFQCVGLPAADTCVLIRHALEHDLHEILDGDTPSSAKRNKALESDPIRRCVQLADKIEAVWFIETRHVNRPDVVADCQRRLSELGEQCPPQWEAALLSVMAELGL